MNQSTRTHADVIQLNPPGGRDVPQNLRAEQALLGAALTNNRALDKVVDFLRPEHFYEPVHVLIYAEMCRLIASNRVADAVTLTARLGRADEFAEWGGANKYLSELMVSMVSISTVPTYAEHLVDCWRRRKLIDIGQRIVAEAHGSQAMPAVDLAARFASELDTSLVVGGAETGEVTATEAMDRAVAAIEQVMIHGVQGISTGLKALDDLLLLERGMLTFLGGRTSMGKSALAFGIFDSAALRLREQIIELVDGGMPLVAARRKVGVVVMFSLEMTAAQAGRRALAARTGFSIESMRKGKLSQGEFDRLFAAKLEMADLPYLIYETPRLKPSVMRMRLRQIRRKYGPIVLVGLDHIHITGTDNDKELDRHNIADLVAKLKAAAKDFDTHIIALAQLSRGLLSRPDKRPGLQDLKESGAIEEGADNVAFVHREHYYLEKARPKRAFGVSEQKYQDEVAEWEAQVAATRGRGEIIVEKARDGRLGVDDVAWRGETTSFTDLPHDPPMGFSDGARWGE